MTDEKKLPEGRLGRLARLAGAGLRAGASMVSESDGEAPLHFYSVLARLDVEADYAGVERDFWPMVDAAARPFVRSLTPCRGPA